jgi:hypothetical protein
MELYEKIEKLMAELSASIKLLRKNGEQVAETEREYKISLAKKALELKEGGMAVTLIDKVVYGEKDVAEKRFDRDIAEAMYEANKEHINVCKLQLRLLEGQVSREWGSAEHIAD